MKAYLAGGTSVFGWHGCVMLEQPRSRSAARSASAIDGSSGPARDHHGAPHGCLQGSSSTSEAEVDRRDGLPYCHVRLGSIVGTLSFAYLPVLVVRSINAVSGRTPSICRRPHALAGHRRLLVGRLCVYRCLVQHHRRRPHPGSTLQPGRRRRRPRTCRRRTRGFGRLWAVTEWLRGRGKSCGFPPPRPKRLTPLSVAGYAA